jgi:eukaryotic-like serine/threonine-protein kinase
MVLRSVALVLAVALLGLAALGMAGWLGVEHGAIGRARGALDGFLGLLGAGEPARLRALGESPVAALVTLGLGLATAWLGLRPAGVRASEVVPGAAPVDARLLRKSARQAASLARQGHLAEAGEVAFASGLLDRAAEYFERAGELVRAAEIHHQLGRPAAAAELYRKADQPEHAGALYAGLEEHGLAADCYFEAGRLSVAGELYEKAGQHQQAGECFARCEFHRHAAQAFAQAKLWLRAAESLEAAILEEGGRVGAGQDPARERELRAMVSKAARLYEQADRLEQAEQVLERGGFAAAAAEIALRRGCVEKAAELFAQAGDAPRAADALRRAGREQEAAQLLAEYHRDRDEVSEAARLFQEAGDFASAGDLHRRLEEFQAAAECYRRGGDPAQAGEMFRRAGDPQRAAECFAEAGHWVEAAECAADLGDPLQEAAHLARAGRFLQAGRLLAAQGRHEEAIQALQQVPSEAPDSGAAAVLLGELFGARGQPALAIDALRRAVQSGPAEGERAEVLYGLARALEEAGELGEAAGVYEQVLAARYGHRDAEARLASVRQRLRGRSGQPAGAAHAPLAERYEIEGELGRGGMGIVYKARDKVLDRVVALKVLPDALHENPRALDNFLREAKSAAKLNHPNIVTVYDAGSQNGQYYIAMEYVDGTTLKEVVRRRGAIAPAPLARILLQLCEALEFAHRAKVIHRDIKTANVMWTRAQKAKIMDFGLARLVEEVRNHTTLVSGTPYYMSPEQTLGRQVDHRTDLYSFGVSLFEMATGRLPFTEGNIPYHHVHTPAPDARTVHAQVPPLLARIISRCLEKDPARRFQSAGEMAALVRQALARRASRGTTPEPR